MLNDELADTIDDIACLRLRKFRMNGQGKRLFRCSFTFGESTGAVPEIRKALLQVHWDGIVDFRSDTFPLEVGLQLIAV